MFPSTPQHRSTRRSKPKTRFSALPSPDKDVSFSSEAGGAASESEDKTLNQGGFMFKKAAAKSTTGSKRKASTSQLPQTPDQLDTPAKRTRRALASAASEMTPPQSRGPTTGLETPIGGRRSMSAKPTRRSSRRASIANASMTAAGPLSRSVPSTDASLSEAPSSSSSSSKSSTINNTTNASSKSNNKSRDVSSVSTAITGVEPVPDVLDESGSMRQERSSVMNETSTMMEDDEEEEEAEPAPEWMREMYAAVPEGLTHGGRFVDFASKLMAKAVEEVTGQLGFKSNEKNVMETLKKTWLKNVEDHFEGMANMIEGADKLLESGYRNPSNIRNADKLAGYQALLEQFDAEIAQYESLVGNENTPGTSNSEEWLPTPMEVGKVEGEDWPSFISPEDRAYLSKGYTQGLLTSESWKEVHAAFFALDKLTAGTKTLGSTMDASSSWLSDLAGKVSVRSQNKPSPRTLLKSI